MSDTIDASVLDASPEGDLIGYIQEQRFEPVAPETDVTVPAVAAFDAPAPDALPVDAQPSLVPQPEVADPALTSQTPPPSEPDQNLLALLNQERQQTESVRRMLNEQIIAAARAQEQAFQASLADMSPEDQRAAVAERQRDMALARAQIAERQAQTVQQTAYANAESQAKARAAEILAARNGLSSEYIPLLMVAPQANQMEMMASRFGQMVASQSVPAQPQVEVAPQLHPNAQTVSGASAPNSPSPPVATPRSGDILSLIQGTPYTTRPINP
jgi:hypothetical protein